MDDRAKTRTKAQADALAVEILKRARAGEDFRSLVRAHSEDWASAQQATSYPVTAAAQLVPPFKALALRLEPGETGLVETTYGWHVMQRIE
jgi:parvulin-like peptidyl-prolyl isomerase